MDRARIHAVLVKLSTGERILRLSDPDSRLALEKAIDPSIPVHTQRERLFQAFEAALAPRKSKAA
jgi:hypothetical protein